MTVHADPGPLRRIRARDASPVLRLGAVDPVATASALVAALGVGTDPLGEVLRTVRDVLGAPMVVLWRADGDRLLLAHREGDCEPVPGTALSGSGEQDEAAAPGIPLDLPASAAAGPRVMLLQGRPFAAVPVADGLLAAGPLPAPSLGRRGGAHAAVLAGLATGPVALAMRVTRLEAELAAMRREVDLGRRALGSTFDEGRAFALLLELALSSAGAPAGLIGVMTEGRLVTRAASGLPTGVAALDLTPDRGILASVPGVPGLLIVDDPAALAAAGAHGLVAVAGPAAAAEPRVVVALLTDASGVLADDCSAMLATLVEQAVLVLESSELARFGAARHLAALEGLCRALDARSPATRNHHALVARAAWVLARRLGLDPAAAGLVRRAALVHDAGLLAATGEAAIAAEYAHPEVGAEMASLVPGAAALAPLIRAHHEWWDGFGFPQGLVGEAIPREARILAAAEFYVELIQAAGITEIPRLVDEVRARRGNQLDPACADMIVQLIEEATWS